MKRTEQRGASVATAQPDAITADKGNAHATTAEMKQAESARFSPAFKPCAMAIFPFAYPGSGLVSRGRSRTRSTKS